MVSADEMIERFGADTGRLFELFAAPPEKDMDWTDAGAEGAYRFLGRVFRFVTRNADRDPLDGRRSGRRIDKALRKLHQTIRQNHRRFRASLALQHLHRGADGTDERALRGGRKTLAAPRWTRSCRPLALLLGPFAPYLAEELWEQLGRTGPVFRQTWPVYDEELAKEDAAEIVLQVNGKVRGRIHVPFGTAKEELERAGSGRSQHAAIYRRQAGGEGDRGARQACKYRGTVKACRRPER